MRKIIFAAAFISFVVSSCSIFHKEKYGCPGAPGGDDWKKKGAMTQDQKIASGENVKQSKFKVQK